MTIGTRSSWPKHSILAFYQHGSACQPMVETAGRADQPDGMPSGHAEAAVYTAATLASLFVSTLNAGGRQMKAMVSVMCVVLLVCMLA
ncbi:MAG: hypothetical protein QNJ48_13700, partial [Desulfobacterales bacterium]|nr:hypothetical protein [Desulfobacterales bacterium]